MKNEFYIDMISKSIISSLSNEIAGNTNSYIKEFLEKEFSGLITDKIKAEIQMMAKQISGIEKMTAQQAEKSAKEIRGYVDEVMQRHLAGYAAEMDTSMKENKKEQSELLKGSIEKALNGQTEKIGSYIEEMKDGLNETVEIKKIIADSNKEIKKHIKEMGIGLTSGNNIDAELKDELTGLKKTLTENKKEEKELLNGVYYSVKKLLGDNGRADASTQLESALADIKKQLKEHTEKQLRIENNSQDKIAKEFHDDINDLKKYIDKKIEKSFKEHGQKNEVHKELTEIKKAMDKNERGQAKLLNGVSDSVKKLTSARSKGKEGSANMMAQLYDMLDALNGHVRLLTSDKDKLSLELMRRVGDDFFQDKFAELEKELEKTKSLADKYLSEKTELTGKLEAFQHLWEQAAVKKD